MDWYVVIAIIVGLVAAFVISRSIMDDVTYQEPKFVDFLGSLFFGLIAGGLIGLLWVGAVPLLAIIYGLWRLYLASQESAKRKKSNRKSYGNSYTTDKTEKRTGIRALFKW